MFLILTFPSLSPSLALSLKSISMALGEDKKQKKSSLSPKDARQSIQAECHHLVFALKYSRGKEWRVGVGAERWNVMSKMC